MAVAYYQQDDEPENSYGTPMADLYYDPDDALDTTHGVPMARSDFDRLIMDGTEWRYEWRNGRIYFMSGSSGPHSQILLNVIMAIYAQYGRRGPCTPYNDRYVEIPPHKAQPKGAVLLPDVVVSCVPSDWSRPKKKGETSATIRFPSLVVEVLSEGSTATYDRTGKLTLYQQCPSLQVYMLLSQQQEQAIVYRRATGWQPEIYEGTASISLSELKLTFTLQEIYEGVFDRAQPDPDAEAI